MKQLGILGSTGSIGTATLEVVRNHPSDFCCDLLVAGSNARLLAQQVRQFEPKIAALSDETQFALLCEELGVSSGSARWNDTRLLCGVREIVDAIGSSRAQLVVAAVVGMAGLAGVLAAIDSGKDVALANKESLVVAGSLVVDRARLRGVKLIPVDSEHSAIFQVLQGVAPSELRSIILTASGGPFLNTPASEFGHITPEQAVRHPRWNMGSKISVDSSTLMNKALEVIEARWLFNVQPEQIEVIIHPQSIIHSMVRLVDETVLAQLSHPDMKGPIAYALTLPGERLPKVMQRLDFAALGELTFRELDHDRFPSVQRALECLRGANGAPAVFNAANEVAVAEFLGGTIGFPTIFRLVDSCLERFAGTSFNSLEEVTTLCSSVSEWARQQARSIPK
jgi:1-deoxy-D-xylulose-5-phosphate reductoisomerase